MTKEDTTQPTLNDRLLAVQVKLNAPKNQRNSFGNYNYRSAEDILEAVKPLLKDQNLVLTISDELVNVGERYYVKATAAVTNGSDSMAVSAYAREPEDKKGMDSSQITGATSSYARKYALNGLFAIDDAKDADTDEHHHQTSNGSYSGSQASSNEPMSDKQESLLRSLMDRAGYDKSTTDARLARITSKAEASEAIEKAQAHLDNKAKRFGKDY